MSVLVHEFGHVAAMRLAGGAGQIVLTAFGGLAIPNVPGTHKRGNAIMVSAAGPLAQIALGLAIAGAVLAAGGAVHLAAGSSGVPFLQATLQGGEDTGSYYIHHAVNFLLYISFFWSLLNLAPVYPLDGGQITRSFLGFKPAIVISLIVASVIALASFLNGNLFLGILFGWLAFSNVQTLIAAVRMTREELLSRRDRANTT